jgi:LAO/AO transport system kinase
LDDVIEAVDQHHEWMTSHGEFERRRTARASAEVEAIAVAQLRDRIGDLRGGDALAQFAKRVMAGEMDPYRAADALIDGLTAG